MANTAAFTGINGLREIRRSPASHLAEAFDSGSVQGTVTLKEGPFQTMAGVRVDPGSEAGTRIGSVTGGLPVRSGEVRRTDRVSVLWLGPQEFLVVAPEDAHDSLGGDLIGSLKSALGDAAGQVVDLSANRTTFELSGPRARAVLEKGCALDLHPRTLKPGTALNTEVGNIPVVLFKSGEESFRLFPRASFADYLGRWILDAMREFASPEVP
jgi:sarcosine oxidase, subunit gamma